MSSIRLVRRLLTYSLIAIYLLSCGQDNPVKEHQHQSGNIFVKTEGQIIIAGQQSNVARIMWQSPDGLIVVNSTLSTSIGISGDKTITVRYLSEFADGDSLFSYDTGDSSFLAIALSDITNKEITALPYSAYWLICNSGISETTGQTDTMTIAGYHCQRFLAGKGFVWMHDRQPMAFESSFSAGSHYEKVIKFVPDTLLPAGCFKQPPGFRKIAPTND